MRTLVCALFFPGLMLPAFACSSSDGGSSAPAPSKPPNAAAWAPTNYDQILRSVWGTSATDVWAVGGQIVHYDGSEVSVASTPKASLNSVWGTSATDVWAVGEYGNIMHWDGKAWIPRKSNTDSDLFGVWAGAEDVAFAVGAKGAIVRWDGKAWAPMKHSFGDGYAISTVWGSGADDVWATTHLAVIHWDGESWTKTDLTATPGAIAGADAKNVWAVGEKGNIFHFDGTEWKKAESPTESTIYGAYALSATDVWAVGPTDILHWDGKVWLTAKTATEKGKTTLGALNDVWASGASDSWAVGDFGAMHRAE